MTEHYHFVISLDKIHANSLEEARGIAAEHLRDLPDRLSYEPWDELLTLGSMSLCLPTYCNEYDEYVEEVDEDEV